MFEKIAKQDVFRRGLIEGAELVGKYQFPKLRPGHNLPHDLTPFNMAATEKNPEGKWVHFFIDDYQFERLWNTPYKYLPILKRFEGVITPDFSMHMDMPLAQQIWNCYRNRVLAYWMQREGLKIVPSVGWSDTRHLDWGLDGLPANSVIAIETNGAATSALKRYGVTRGAGFVIDRLRPTAVMVYGSRLPGLSRICRHTVMYDSYCQNMKGRI